jgi:uncharacterized phage-associated protein
MADVFDVAAYILQEKGAITSWKLQKLVYYSQAWSLVWDEEPLFQERIEAWANGPVCPDLYQKHRGQFIVKEIKDGAPRLLSKDERETVDAVLGYYGSMHPQELSDLTHSEAPWLNARDGLPPSASCQTEITLDAMAAFYEGLPAPA